MCIWSIEVINIREEIYNNNLVRVYCLAAIQGKTIPVNRLGQALRVPGG